jgi:DNA-directed RNA polymerase subunit F
MAGREILEKREVTLAEVKKHLEERQGEGDLTLTHRVTLDYVTKVAKLQDAEKGRELVEKLVGMGLQRSTAIQVVNIMPKNTDELRTCLVGERKTFLKTDLEKILKKLSD